MGFKLENRRYTGSKAKLADWILNIIGNNCSGSSFIDLFAGTGIVGAKASNKFEHVIFNDLLYSNFTIYKAFFEKSRWDKEKLKAFVIKYSKMNSEKVEDNYFSENFGGKYFSLTDSKIIGFIREDIEKNKECLTKKEYNILLTSLLYSVDKIANTVGHYDAYFKKENIKDRFCFELIDPQDLGQVDIYKEDANLLAKKISADVVYIDPPYNSRQYSRFYHVLETLVKWDKSQLFGVAMKPEPENMSDYCRISATDRFAELIADLNCKNIVVSYNNTYDSKSSSSRNKISHEDIKNILSSRGETQVFEKDYKFFNSGKTEFDNHKEFVFFTTVRD